MSRVFVLGAGASRGAGYPLAQDLFGEVYQRLPTDDTEVLDRALRALYPSAPTPSRRTIKNTKIEELMSLLDAAEEFNSILPTTFLTPSVIRRLRRALLRGVWYLFVEQQAKAELSRKSVRYIDVFLRKLQPDDVVVSFNWDTLLERRASHNGIALNVTTDTGAGSGIPLLKLHGSIDWFEGAELAQSDRSHYVAIHRQLYQATWSHVREPGHERWKDLVPFIVPPTYFKTFRGRTDMEELWAQAFLALEGASEVYLCGYRLPEEDLFARVAFVRAIRANILKTSPTGRKRSFRLIVVNPAGEVLDKVRAEIYANAKHDPSRFETSALLETR